MQQAKRIVIAYLLRDGNPCYCSYRDVPAWNSLKEQFEYKPKVAEIFAEQIDIDLTPMPCRTKHQTKSGSVETVHGRIVLKDETFVVYGLTNPDTYILSLITGVYTLQRDFLKESIEFWE